MTGAAQCVVVTGAGGFIGRGVLRTLQERGFTVHAADLRRPDPVPPGIHWHEVDLFDHDQVVRLMESVCPTHLLHFAWFVKHGEFWTAADNLPWVRASLDLYQAFHAAGGRRMVTSGTCAEYDWTHSLLAEEETPLHPATLYGACKHGLNIMSSAYAATADIRAAWGRVFLLYGPHENPRRLVAGAIRSLLKGEPFACSHGSQQRDFLHVQDVADAFAALLDSEVEGNVNIASGELRSVADVLAEIGRQLGREELIEFGARPASPDEPPVLEAAVARLHDDVGWAPAYSLPEGIADAIAWWRRNLDKET